MKILINKYFGSSMYKRIRKSWFPDACNQQQSQQGISANVYKLLINIIKAKKDFWLMFIPSLITKRTLTLK